MNNNLQAAISLLEFAVLADPIQRNPFGKLDLPGDRALGVVDGALHVAAAHAESDRDVATEAFPINERGALRRTYIGDLAERNVTAARLGDLNLTYRLGALPVFGLPAKHQVEAPVSFKDLRHRLHTDRGLHDGGDVADV